MEEYMWEFSTFFPITLQNQFFSRTPFLNNENLDL